MQASAPKKYIIMQGKGIKQKKRNTEKEGGRKGRMNEYILGNIRKGLRSNDI